MSYVSLYRRYRPSTFDKVIGQDHIVRTLKNQIANGSVGHAYIFTGTRGTGKTSVAKIFARAVNCLHPVDGSPCGECETCLALSNGGNFDIVEMDAASNNSVEQIRDLTDRIGFPPTAGKYKVYIIDEVHMLSGAAFNALLKTLEEPPQHAIFILATTEIHKIPATILSRCLRFDFRLVPTPVISKRLADIYDDIGVTYTKEAVDLIANAGAGSVRDALSIADMCVSYCAGNVTYDGVLEVLGAADPSKLSKLLTEILNGDIEAALTDISNLVDIGKSVSTLSSDLAEMARNALYIKHCASARQLLPLPENLFGALSSIARQFETSRLLYVMSVMSGLEGELRYTSQHRILLEGAVVKACVGDEASKTDDIAKRVDRLERAFKAKRDFSSPPVVTDARQVWIKIASGLKAKGYHILASILEEADTEMTDGEFCVSVSDPAAMKVLSERQNLEAMRDMLASLPETEGKRLTVKEAKKLNEDMALPYVKEMFGDVLEIK